MAKRLVIANWKTYIDSPEAAKKFTATLRRKMATITGVDAWIAPPATLLPLLGKGPYKLGGQTTSSHERGAHTGDITAAMLKAAGASFCIVGHSERRTAGESADTTRAQMALVLKQGLVAVLCVGEVERTADGMHFGVIADQLRSAVAGLQAFAGKIIIAYEPVWAIGKQAQDAMHAQDLEETVIFIKKTLAETLGRAAGLKTPILYGGSVEPDNAKSLLSSGVSGFLVGHASTEVESFVDILKACKK